MSELYFSRVKLKRDAHVEAIKSLLLPQLVETHEQTPQTLDARHKLIWSLFADDEKRQRDFLWREDKVGAFYILSQRKPDNPNFDIDTKNWAPHLSTGDRLAFTLRVNPVIRRKSGKMRKNRKGNMVPEWKKHDIVMDVLRALRPANSRTEDEGERRFKREALMQEQGTSWLGAQGEANGFAPCDVQCTRYYLAQVAHSNHAQRAAEPMRYAAMEFEGTLQITDPAAFLQKLNLGFGAAKAFGCGLMLIRRV